MTAPRIHELKAWPRYFQAVLDGIKRSEVRRDDRGFMVGDILLLREYDPTSGRYSGRTVERRITYISDLAGIGVTGGFVSMELEAVARSKVE